MIVKEKINLLGRFMKRFNFIIICIIFFIIILSCKKTYKSIESPTIGLMIQVPGGAFHWGSGKDNILKISSFYMSAYEVTRKQFVDIMGYDPADLRYSGSENDPVQNINWYHAIAFCNTVSIREGLEPVYTVDGINFDSLNFKDIPIDRDKNWDKARVDWNANGYRLPTEAEWQWAAMGARDKNDLPFSGSNGRNSIDDYAWYYANAGDKYLDVKWLWDDIVKNKNRTHEVGLKLPNKLGIYDMSGNVWELCWDYYEEIPNGELQDYRGPDQGNVRVYRGGGWHDPFSPSNYMAVKFRYIINPEFQQPSVGVRLAKNVPLQIDNVID